MRTLLHRLCGLMIMTASTTYGQTLLAPRPLSLGGGSAAVHDLRGFDINPAGLPGIRDWEVAASSFVELYRSGDAAVFQSVAVGKGFGGNHGVAFAYSPGTSMEFVFPSGTYISGAALITGELRALYAERFALGYGFAAGGTLSLGAGFRVRTEQVTDTQYELLEEDTTSVILTREVVDEGVRLLGDLSLLWQPVDAFRLAAVGRGLLSSPLAKLPEDLAGYALSDGRRLELACAWDAAEAVSLLAEGATTGMGSVGVDLRPGAGFEVRASGYGDLQESRLMYALGFGVGWTYGFLTVDAGYIHFLRQEGRDGNVTSTAFDPTRINAIDLNPYTGDRLGISLKADFGARERLAMIESVRMLGGIYPSSSERFAYQPIGTARVKNVSTRPVYVRVRFYVDRFMDAPTESQPVHLIPGEAADIPITAVLNERVKSVPRMVVRDAEVTVSATPAEEYDDRRQTPVVIHGRNDWDGDVHTLRYFVTPSDPSVIRYARDILLENADSLGGDPGGMLPYRKARLLLSGFANNMMYVSDPRQSADFVQYPSETIELRGGDCDDMTVCFSALLNSIGIPTAFVDVIPPDRPDQAHIYLLFDTGLEPRFAEGITTNSKRYVVRRNQAGVETVWIPIESTVIRRGFDEAWSAGAQRYLDDVEIGLGIVKGWVKIVDVY